MAGFPNEPPNGAYVATIGPSNGTDDTAHINALLAAAGAGLVKGDPGQTYVISAPLVVPSNTLLDMTGCTVTLKAGSNCNMVNNAAVSTTAAAAADAATTSGSNVVTTSLGAQAVAGQTLVVAGAGGNGNGPLVGQVASATATTITLNNLGGSALNATASVSAAAVSLYNRDTNVAVKGGTWQRGANAGTGWAAHSLRFRHVDSLTVTDILPLETAGKYFVNPADCTDVLVERIRGANVSSNVVQPNGPIRGLTIRDIAGTSADDMVALVPVDWAAYADSCGDMTNVLVENVRAASSGQAVVKVLGGSGVTVSNVTVRTVRGICTGTTSPVTVGDDGAQAGTTGGTLDTVHVEDIEASAPNGTPLITLNGTGLVRASIDRWRFDNSAATIAPINISMGSAHTIDRLKIGQGTIVGLGAVPIISINSNTTVTSLLIDEAAITNLGSSSNSLVSVGGTVTNLIVDGVTVDAMVSGASVVLVTATVTDLTVTRTHVTGTGGYLLSVFGATGSLARAACEAVHLNGIAGLAAAATAGATLGELVGSAVLNNTAWVADLNTTTTFNMVLSQTNGTNGAFNVRASAVITVVNIGDVNVGNSITAGGALYSHAPQWRTRIDTLSHDLNSVANNTNSGLACGVGPVVCTGTGVAPNWKNVASGATY